VSAKEQITKLEALLARVSSRANEPRIAAAHTAAPAPAAPPPAPPTLVVSPPIVVGVSEPDIDVVHETTETPAAAKSDARLIAAKPAESLDLDSAVDSSETLLDAHLESIPVEEAPPDVEVPEEEPAPSSSRRPISPPAAEEIAETAFGADDLSPPPRHTPPPESGRLPAAPELAPVIDVDDEVQDITGVHHTPAAERPAAPAVEDTDSLARSGEHEGLSSSPDEVTPPPAAVSRVALTPHIARPERSASAPVGDPIGQAMAFSPATFGELLDATLAL
jgi:hypothetical protein